MLSGRMLKIVEYLEKHPQTTLKEISVDLQLNIRYVRYDIDKINNILKEEQLPLIEKKHKGIILYPKELNIEYFTENENFVCTVQERMNLMLLMLLFDKQNLRFNRMSEYFQVSRSTIKKDFNTLLENLQAEGIEVEYINYYHIYIYDKNLYRIVNELLMQFIEIYQKQDMDYDFYQLYVKEILDRRFAPISVFDVITWTKQLSIKYGYEFNDDEYKWYVSNILIVIYNSLMGIQLPNEIGFDAIDDYPYYKEDIESLEKLINHRLEHYYKGAFIHLVEYLNKNDGLSEKMDIIYIQSIINQLIESMSYQLGVDFSKDPLLIKGGLVSHLTALIKRVGSGIVFKYKAKTNISKKNEQIIKSLKEVLSQIEILNQITDDDEIAHLAVYFIASIRRLKVSSVSNVLIVCYHGYGSATLLKDVLMEEYKVNVVDVIPSYKLSVYDLEDVDCIISTLPLKDIRSKRNIVVSPILTYQDRENLENIGIERKDNLIDFHSLKEKLSFLDVEDRVKVLKIIQNELGQSNDFSSKSIYKISSLLKENTIFISDQDMDWKKAITDSSNLLVQSGMVKESYGNKILKEIEKLGFYCVTDEYFALFHGKENEDVYYGGMSLIINKENVVFGDKKAKIIFCLASKDKKDQIPAMMMLMRMIKKTNLLSSLEKAGSVKEVLEIFHRCEEAIS